MSTADKIKTPRVFDAVVFDLGNVLIDVDFSRSLKYWSANGAQIDSHAFDRFLNDDEHIAFEKGDLQSREFFQILAHSFGLPNDENRLRQGWNFALGKEIAGVRTVLEQFRKLCPIYCFSNTNSVHYHYFREQHANLHASFKTLFVSYQLKKRKPDSNAFQAVIDAIGVAPNRILFFDDNQENIAAAKALGLLGIRVTEVQKIATMSPFLD